MRGLYLGSRMIDGEPGVSPYVSPGDQVLKSERTLGIYKFMALQLARELGPGRARLSRAVNNTDIPGLWPLRYVFSVLRILLCAIKDALGVLALVAASQAVCDFFRSLSTSYLCFPL